MAEQIRVYAVRGKLVSHPVRRNSYVGYRQVTGPAAADAMVKVRNGLSYDMAQDGEVVENTYRIRQSVRKGALATSRAVQPAPKKKARPAEGKEA